MKYVYSVRAHLRDGSTVDLILFETWQNAENHLIKLRTTPGHFELLGIVHLEIATLALYQ